MVLKVLNDSWSEFIQWLQWKNIKHKIDNNINQSPKIRSNAAFEWRQRNEYWELVQLIQLTNRHRCVMPQVGQHQQVTLEESLLRAFRHLIKLVVNKSCYWLKQITWSILANSRCCLLQVVRLYYSRQPLTQRRCLFRRKRKLIYL